MYECRNVSGIGRDIMWVLPGGSWQGGCQKPGLRYNFEEKSYVDVLTPPL